MFVTVFPTVVAPLQGKSDPDASRGELLGLPYGGGVSRIMWPLAEVKNARAEAARTDLTEGMLLWLCPCFVPDEGFVFDDCEI